MCLNHSSVDAMFSGKNEGDHVFKPGLIVVGLVEGYHLLGGRI